MTLGVALGPFFLISLWNYSFVSRYMVCYILWQEIRANPYVLIVPREINFILNSVQEVNDVPINILQ